MLIKTIKWPHSLKVGDLIVFEDCSEVFIGKILSFTQEEDYPAAEIGHTNNSGDRHTQKIKLKDLERLDKYQLVIPSKKGMFDRGFGPGLSLKDEDPE